MIRGFIAHNSSYLTHNLCEPRMDLNLLCLVKAQRLISITLLSLECRTAKLFYGTTRFLYEYLKKRSSNIEKEENLYKMLFPLFNLLSWWWYKNNWTNSQRKVQMRVWEIGNGGAVNVNTKLQWNRIDWFGTRVYTAWSNMTESDKTVSINSLSVIYSHTPRYITSFSKLVYFKKISDKKTIF